MLRTAALFLIMALALAIAGAEFGRWLGDLAGEIVAPEVAAAESADSDGDRFSDAAESYVGTDPLSPCSWPPDATDNLLVGIDDVFFGASRFGGATARAEIGSQNGQVGIDDVFRFAVYFGGAASEACPSGEPEVEPLPSPAWVHLGSGVYEITCGVWFRLANVFGQNVIDFQLRQTFTVDGYDILRWYDPVVTATTRWGWSSSDFSQGSRWVSQPLGHREVWATATFRLNVAWFTVQSYRPTIGLDLYGNGNCVWRGEF